LDDPVSLVQLAAVPALRVLPDVLPLEALAQLLAVLLALQVLLLVRTASAQVLLAREDVQQLVQVPVVQLALPMLPVLLVQQLVCFLVQLV